MDIQALTDVIPQLLPYLAYLGAASVSLRLLAEILNKISVATENKADDKVAAFVSEASWQVAKVAAIFGVRTTLAVPEHLKEDEKGE